MATLVIGEKDRVRHDAPLLPRDAIPPIATTSVVKRTGPLAGEVMVILMIKRWIGHTPNTGISEGTTTGSGTTTGKAVETTREIDGATMGALTKTEMIPGGGESTDVVIYPSWWFVFIHASLEHAQLSTFRE